MPRYKLTIEYDGSPYNGWQVQKNETTVQGKLIEACSKIADTPIKELYGAGRTDAGVHALGQVAHVDFKQNIKPEQLKYELNELLPATVSVVNVEAVKPNFHARYDAVARSYVYQIAQRKTAFGKKYVWWVKDSLDAAYMQKIASLFAGFHDFSSFGENEKEDGSTKVEMIGINVTKTGDSILIHFLASHYLWKMVRRLTGVLVEAGRRNITEKNIENWLKFKSNEPAKLTAPPSGLYLENVYYQKDYTTIPTVSLLNLRKF